MNPEKFESIQPELERIGVKLTIEQAAELEAIIAGKEKPVLVVEKGHVSYDYNRGDILYTMLMALFTQSGQSKLATSLQRDLLMVVMTLFAVTENPDEAIDEFVKAAKFRVDDFRRYLKDEGVAQVGIPIRVHSSSKKS